MAFTRGWDNTTPPGTRNANEIDNAIRELRVDIDERMASKLFTTVMPNTTVEADIVVKPEIKGNVTGKIIFVHGTQFQIDTGENADYSGNGIQFASEAAPIRAPLIIPVGVTITKIRWLVTNNLAHTLSLYLKRLEFATGLTQSTLDTQTHALATTIIKDSGVISVLIETGYAYFLEADIPGSSAINLGTIHAVEITYTTPDCRNTI